MPYLDAILKETMRLKPAVPGGQPRVTPSEGLQVGSKWIPGDINVLVPQYALQRDDRFFPEASKFLPERWLDRKEDLIVDEQAYFPFQIGQYYYLPSFDLFFFSANIPRSSRVRGQGICDDVYAYICLTARHEF